MSVDGAYDVVYADSKNKKITLTAQNQNLLDLELSNFCEITFDKEAIQKGMDEITFKDFLQGKTTNILKIIVLSNGFHLSLHYISHIIMYIC